jgi:hypothetical protein
MTPLRRVRGGREREGNIGVWVGLNTHVQRSFLVGSQVRRDTLVAEGATATLTDIESD